MELKALIDYNASLAYFDRVIDAARERQPVSVISAE
jgi:hypothetical protein